MGTRHLTIVIDKNGELKVAQYGQWDGYLDGQGVNILRFLYNLKGNYTEFNERLQKTKFINNDEEFNKRYKKFCNSIGVKNGWADIEQSGKIDKEYPTLSRDVGSDILHMINNTEHEIPIYNDLLFAVDSLFCEYCYEIDLAKRKFNVYKGFNKQPLKEGERFFELQNEIEKDSEYYPIKLMVSFDLDDLPTEEEFTKSEIEDEE